MESEILEDFVEDTKDPLVGISVSDSTELWLIQWPINQVQPADLSGKEISLKLHHDGQLGSFATASGKTYEVVSVSSQPPDATVFATSDSGAKVVGKISRRVSLVHYPDPDEIERPDNSSLRPGSSRKSLSQHEFTPSQSIKRGSTQSMGQTLPSIGTSKRSNIKSSQSSLHSGKARSSLFSPGTSKQSHGEGKSKKKKIKHQE
ncbi:Mediator-associated protein 2 [Acorus calamus]|uniref:Mediator-associated protein 2 n=1 Tax=Acorus calamus TaxID=4465 RepID=A0AAV9CYT0_ACOCL|nr:Mediator-associated protein 2 [Acorus calamus]